MKVYIVYDWEEFEILAGFFREDHAKIYRDTCLDKERIEIKELTIE